MHSIKIFIYCLVLFFYIIVVTAAESEIKSGYLEDILLEVQSQMRSLKRQASKARAFKTIGLEIQKLELELNANMYQELKEESGHRSRSSDDLLQQEVALRTHFSNIQSRIETMNLELEERN